MTIESEWEKYHGGPTEAPHTRMYASVNPRKNILFNDRIYRELGKPEAVDLYFNRTRDQIGLKPTSARLPAAFPVRERGRGSREVRAAPFFQHFGIKIDATYRFLNPDISDGQLILKLAEVVRVARTTKQKGR